MERDEFIKSLGLGLALVCTGTCFQACSKGDSDDNAPGNGGNNGNPVTVDLSQRLMNIGDQTKVGTVLVFRVATGNQPASFVATQAICPHAGGSLSWMQNTSRIQCALHNAQYSTAGAVLQQPQGGGSTQALKVYTTAVSGNTLTVNVA